MVRVVLLGFLFCWGLRAHCADIAVLSMAIGEDYLKITQECINNKKRYCERQGYDFICAYETLDGSRHPAWSKLKLIERHLNDYQWVFWTDADSLVMNMDVRLETLVDQNCWLVISKDCNGVNSGQFLIRSCPESREFLQQCYAMEQFIDHPWWEQAAIQHYLNTHPSCLQCVKVVPQRRINSYPPSIAGAARDSCYRRGDFVIHFPGARGENLAALIHEYVRLQDKRSKRNNR
jgi:mannan polymerase II complex MNN10 subunit